MEVNILHLYPDCMNLYGEWANVEFLRRKLADMGAEVTVTKNPLDRSANFTAADVIYMGCGTERTQKAAMMTLKDRSEDLKEALERGALVIFTGNAMEILGRSVTDALGQTWPGMGLAEFTTVERDRRTSEDVIARTPLLDEPVVGFMNKCSATAGVAAPLFAGLDLGFGNEGEKGPEGYVDGNLFATHITGPILVKNPHLLDLMARRVFENKGWAVPEAVPAIPHQREVYEVTLRELSARVKEA